MLHEVREAVLDALAVLLPVDCAGCGAPDRALCARCRRAMVATPQRSAVAGIQVASALRYEGTVRRAILAFKESGRTDVARALAEPLALAIGLAAAGESALAGHAQPLELCVVPATRRAHARRGYRPVDVLVAAAGFRVPRQVLRQVHDHDDQKSLGRDARGRNLVGSLVARPAASGRRFLLIDDILTTGATVSEAARALRAAGAEVVAAATLAYTPRRFPANPGA